MHLTVPVHVVLLDFFAVLWIQIHMDPNLLPDSGSVSGNIVSVSDPAKVKENTYKIVISGLFLLLNNGI